MSPVLFLAVSVAGGIGASLRFVLDGLIRTRVDQPTPWGTIIINVTGSFLLGLLVGLVASNLVPSSWLPILGTGFLGGYTTFSTASVDTVKLLEKHQRGAAWMSGAGTLVASIAAAGSGLWLGSLA